MFPVRSTDIVAMLFLSSLVARLLQTKRSHVNAVHSAANDSHRPPVDKLLFGICLYSVPNNVGGRAQLPFKALGCLNAHTQIIGMEQKRCQNGYPRTQLWYLNSGRSATKTSLVPRLPNFRCRDFPLDLQAIIFPQVP